MEWVKVIGVLTTVSHRRIWWPFCDSSPRRVVVPCVPEVGLSSSSAVASCRVAAVGLAAASRERDLCGPTASMDSLRRRAASVSRFRTDPPSTRIPSIPHCRCGSRRCRAASWRCRRRYRSDLPCSRCRCRQGVCASSCRRRGWRKTVRRRRRAGRPVPPLLEPLLQIVVNVALKPPTNWCQDRTRGVSELITSLLFK